MLSCFCCHYQLMFNWCFCWCFGYLSSDEHLNAESPLWPGTFSFRDQIPLTDVLRTLWLSSRYLSEKCASHTFASAHFGFILICDSPSIDLIKTTLDLFIPIKQSISKGKLLRATFLWLQASYNIPRLGSSHCHWLKTSPNFINTSVSPIHKSHIVFFHEVLNHL